MNSKAKKKSPVVLIASISLILLVAIIGSIYYKYEVAESTANEETNVPADATNDEQVNKLKEVEELDAPLEEEGESEVDSVDATNEPTESKPVPSNDKPASTPTDSAKDSKTINGYIVDQKPATEPTYVNGILIANKKNPLPATYNKGEDPAARAAFEKMAVAAKEEAGFELVAFSGFRSYEYQKTLYDRYVSRDGKDAADRYSARPGYSEHQTGLAFDIGEKSQEDLWLTSAFGETKAGQWLVNNAHKYGFILRYPKGKEDITGFMYESWHFRYLEGDTATKVYEAGVTLEEYLGIQ